MSARLGKLGLYINVAPGWSEDPPARLNLIRRNIQWTQGKQTVSESYPYFADMPLPNSSTYTQTIQNKIQTYTIEKDLKPVISIANSYTIPMWLIVQAHSWDDPGKADSLDWREPTTYETRVLTNLGLAYGAKGILYFVYQQQDLGLGLVDTNGAPRRMIYSGTAYEGDKWASIKAINGQLALIGPTLVTLTWQDAISRHLLYGSFSKFNLLGGASLTNITTSHFGVPDSADHTYVEVGSFKDPSNVDYLMAVNRRTDSTGSRDISLVFNNAASWALTEMASGTVSMIPANGTFTASYSPGEGRLYRIILKAPTPALNSPADSATGITHSPTLSWSADAVTGYHLQVSTDSSFTGLTVDDSTLTTTSKQIGPLGNDTKYHWRVRARNAAGWGDWSQARSFTTSRIVSHGITLAQGWNMNSSFVTPQNTILDTLLADIRPNLYILKNNTGQVYWPAFSIDQIGHWNSKQGYQIYMNSADTLTMTGLEVDPQATPDTLSSGWNLPAYLRNNPMRVDSAVNSIASALVIVKNNAGQVYMPQYGINQIGSMRPGQGYQIYVTAISILLYPANLAPAPLYLLTKRQVITLAQVLDLKPQHFKLGIKNTGANSTLLIESPGLNDGDEIAVCTMSNQVVGVGVANAGKVLMTVWGENDLTKDKISGPKKGETLRLTYWNSADGKEDAVTLGGLQDHLNKRSMPTTLKYETDGVWIAQIAGGKSGPTSFDLFENYPNPFNPSTLIKYSLPSNCHVTLKVFDILGREVMKLVDEQQEAGIHQVVFDAGNLSSGIYFYSIRAGQSSSVKKMLFAK
jgi:hypothetical protein